MLNQGIIQCMVSGSVCLLAGYYLGGRRKTKQTTETRGSSNTEETLLHCRSSTKTEETKTLSSTEETLFHQHSSRSIEETNYKSPSTDLDDRTCRICSKIISTKANLRRHITQIHGDKKYKCTICNHQCNRASNLKQHMKIHE